ncbi:MAG: SpaA isopeptide-forming pilin-related protein, partial [Actinomycetota bacterium]
YASDGTTILDTQLSGSDGSYKFSNLAPGTYWVGETLLTIDWDNTTPLKLKRKIVIVDAEVFVTIADFGNVLAVLPFTPQPSPAPTPTPEVLPFTGGQPILLRWPFILGTAAVLGWILMAVGYLITRLEKKRS